MKHANTNPLTGLFYFQARPTHYQPRIVPDGMHEIEIILEGKGIFCYNGAAWRVTAGDMAWFYPGDIIEATGDEDAPYLTCVLVFQVTEPPVHRPPFISTWESPSSARNFCSSARNLLACGDETPADVWQTLWHRMHWETIQSELIMRSSTLPLAVARALDYIEKHHLHDITVQDIAQAAGVSASHLHLLFRNALGVSPMHRVLELRIETARNLLMMTDKTVKEISAASGYNDVNNFCAYFKKMSSRSPAEFRIASRENKLFKNV